MNSKIAGLYALLFCAVVRADDQPPVLAAPQEHSATSSQRSEDLRLDPSSIRGNQELPKVLYIVPWKAPAGAAPTGLPFNSLLDETIAPVDRDVFRRQMRYFDQLYAPTKVSSPESQP